MTESSIPAVLRERASLQPNDAAFTFVDYEKDWEGVSETLTWSQLYRRTLNVAHELRRHGSAGDRAVILAPQGLDYIAAFLGALEAGHIAVPLSVPAGGVADERVISVLADTSPAVLLTTTAVAENVGDYVRPRSAQGTPVVVEVDSLALDARIGAGGGPDPRPATAYLQYTSGSTRIPAGVMVSNANLFTNFGQINADYFAEYGKVAPPDTTVVTWAPFYHDMGLILGIVFPVLGGYRSVITSPVSFLARPARWMQLLARHSHAFTAGPNFAFDLAARKTTDDDMAGLDLANVLTMINGSERIHPATLRRFTERFASLNLPGTAVRPSYGLAEATVYVATRRAGEPPKVVDFDPDELSAGHAIRCAGANGTPLVSYGMPLSQTVRIVDPQTCTQCPAGTVGEIWLQGGNVALGYWEKPAESERTFGGRIADAGAGTPAGQWLRTGDMGFVFDGELFIIGRIKDLLIVRGRNHSPDDIEATVQEVAPGRCAAIAVPHAGTEQLVVIMEVKKRGDDAEEARHKLRVVKRDVTSAISTSHGLSVADLVLVPPGSIPITTSGKVRRQSCVEHYRQDRFARLDA